MSLTSEKLATLKKRNFCIAFQQQESFEHTILWKQIINNAVLNLMFTFQLNTKLAAFALARPFLSPEAALLLVSTKSRDLLPCPTTEIRDSRTSRHAGHTLSQVWQIWLVLVSIYFVYKSIQNRNVVGPGQRSRFLVLTNRNAAYGDENVARP